MLAWERSAIGALATAALLSLRPLPGPALVQLAVPASAVVLGLVLAVVGRRRAQLLRAGGTPAAPVAVLVSGGGTVALGLVILTLLAVA